MDILRLHTGAKREIRTAFLLLLRTKSFATVTLLDIAVKTGISPNEIKALYPGTHTLLQELAADLANGLTGLMRAANTTGLDDLLEKLCSGCHPVFLQYLAYVRENHTAFALMGDAKRGAELRTAFYGHMLEYRAQSLANWQKLNGSGNAYVLAMLYNQNMDDILNSFIHWAQTGMQVDETRMAELQSRAWVSTMLGLKDSAPNSIYQRLLAKLAEKGVEVPDAIPPACNAILYTKPG